MLKICFGLCTQVSGRIFSLIKDEQFSLWFYCLLPSDRFSIWCIQGSTSGSVCLSLCKYIYTHICHAFLPSVTQKLPGGLCVQQFCRRSRESNPQSFLHIRSFTASSQALGEKKKEKKVQMFFFLFVVECCAGCWSQTCDTQVCCKFDPWRFFFSSSSFRCSFVYSLSSGWVFDFQRMEIPTKSSEVASEGQPQ